MGVFTCKCGLLVAQLSDAPAWDSMLQVVQVQVSSLVGALHSRPGASADHYRVTALVLCHKTPMLQPPSGSALLIHLRISNQAIRSVMKTTLREPRSPDLELGDDSQQAAASIGGTATDIVAVRYEFPESARRQIFTFFIPSLTTFETLSVRTHELHHMVLIGIEIHLPQHGNGGPPTE